MNSVVILLLGGFIFLRAFSFLLTYVELHRYRNSECIERIRKQQMACDVLCVSYHLFTMLAATFFITATALHLSETGDESMRMFYIVSLATIMVCYAIFFVLKAKKEIGYDLRNFYNDMVDYRSKQKVVTADNDHEVEFIMGYRHVMKHKRYVNMWFVAMLAYALNDLRFF